MHWLGYWARPREVVSRCGCHLRTGLDVGPECALGLPFSVSIADALTRGALTCLYNHITLRCPFPAWDLRCAVHHKALSTGRSTTCVHRQSPARVKATPHSNSSKLNLAKATPTSTEATPLEQPCADFQSPQRPLPFPCILRTATHLFLSSATPPPLPCAHLPEHTAQMELHNTPTQ